VWRCEAVAAWTPTMTTRQQVKTLWMEATAAAWVQAPEAALGTNCPTDCSRSPAWEEMVGTRRAAQRRRRLRAGASSPPPHSMAAAAAWRLRERGSYQPGEAAEAALVASSVSPTGSHQPGEAAEAALVASSVSPTGSHQPENPQAAEAARSRRGHSSCLLLSTTAT
jgi:hypothetical protein